MPGAAPIHLAVIVVAVVVVSVFGVLASRRVKSSEDMLVSGRSLGLFFVAWRLHGRSLPLPRRALDRRGAPPGHTDPDTRGRDA